MVRWPTFLSQLFHDGDLAVFAAGERSYGTRGGFRFAHVHRSRFLASLQVRLFR